MHFKLEHVCEIPNGVEIEQALTQSALKKNC